jgi:hypothetical protein
MMKRKLKKQIDKSQKDVRKHNRAIDKARQDAIDKHPPNRDDTIQKAIKKATDPHKPNVQKGVAMRKRSQKALDRLNRPESKPVNADKPKPDLFKSRNR